MIADLQGYSFSLHPWYWRDVDSCFYFRFLFAFFSVFLNKCYSKCDLSFVARHQTIVLVILRWLQFSLSHRLNILFSHFGLIHVPYALTSFFLGNPPSIVGRYSLLQLKRFWISGHACYLWKNWPRIQFLFWPVIQIIPFLAIMDLVRSTSLRKGSTLNSSILTQVPCFHP